MRHKAIHAARPPLTSNVSLNDALMQPNLAIARCKAMDGIPLGMLAKSIAVSKVKGGEIDLVVPADLDDADFMARHDVRAGEIGEFIYLASLLP